MPILDFSSSNGIAKWTFFRWSAEPSLSFCTNDVLLPIDRWNAKATSNRLQYLLLKVSFNLTKCRQKVTDNSRLTWKKSTVTRLKRLLQITVVKVSQHSNGRRELLSKRSRVVSILAFQLLFFSSEKGWSWYKVGYQNKNTNMHVYTFG